MQDVAAHAGVSLKTVSRVVNRELGVRPAVAERVRASIAALGFRRNEAARLLARGRSIQAVGLVIENISNEFFGGIAQAVEDSVLEHDALLVIGSYGERPHRERMIIEAMYARGVQSAIMVPGEGDHSWLAEHLDMGLRAVFLDRTPAGLSGVDSVLIDNLGGGVAATRHLISQGHRRIGYVSDAPEIESIASRTAGYRRALGEAGLPVDDELIIRDVFEPAAVQGEVTRLLEAPDPPTAFFAANNRAAIGVYRAVQGRAVQGRDIGLIGFDDFALADLLGVSVMRYDLRELARTAVRFLFDPAAEGRQVVLPTELVLRGS